MEDTRIATQTRDLAYGGIYRRANLFLPSLTAAKWDIASFLFTHLGLCAPWFCTPETWREAQGQIQSQKSATIRDRTGIVTDNELSEACMRPLLLETMRLSRDLHTSVAWVSRTIDKAYREDVTMAKNAFALTPNSNSEAKSKALIGFTHRFMTSQLLDRCIHAFSLANSLPSRQNRDYIKYVAEIRANQATELSQQLPQSKRGSKTGTGKNTPPVEGTLERLFNDLTPRRDSHSQLTVSPRLMEFHRSSRDWVDIVDTFIADFEGYSTLYIPRPTEVTPNHKGITDNSMVVETAAPAGGEVASSTQVANERPGLVDQPRATVSSKLDPAIANKLRIASDKFGVSSRIYTAYSNLCACAYGVFEIIHVSIPNSCKGLS